MSDYFPDMRRIETEHGDYVEPALNQDWPMLTKLEWQLAVLRVDTGIRMTVRPGHSTIDGYEIPYLFAYSAMNHGWSARSFNESWDFINGVSTGAMLMRERVRDREAVMPKRWTQPDFAPGISSVIRDRIKADGWQAAFQDRVNDMKAELRLITDSLGYRAQDITVLSDEPVTL